MKLFTQWARREYTFTQRLLLTLLLGGTLFIFLIPLALIRPVPRLDTLLHLPKISFGAGNIVVGCLFIGVGLFFGLWTNIAQMTRARGTPIPVMPTHTLLVDGPFKLCRNPMSFGAITIYLGVGILVGSISDILVVLLFAGLLILYIKKIEERELEARFGEAYLAYKARTPFIIPRISSREVKD